MKKILLLGTLWLVFGCNPKGMAFKVVFDNHPCLFGTVPVVYENIMIGVATGAVEEKKGGMFVLPITIEPDFTYLMGTNTVAVVKNNVIEIRLQAIGHAVPLPEDSGIKGFTSEWSFKLASTTNQVGQWFDKVGRLFDF